MIRNPEKCLLTSLFPEFQAIKKCYLDHFNTFVIFFPKLKIPQTRINAGVAGLL